MDKDHVKINTPGTLTITAQKVSGQPPATHGGQQIAINYLSGAIGAKQKFRVDAVSWSPDRNNLPITWVGVTLVKP